MDPPSTLQCELQPYQKQDLYWMTQLEKGKHTDEGATTLEPCWEAYYLSDKRDLVVYLNTFPDVVDRAFLAVWCSDVVDGAFHAVWCSDVDLVIEAMSYITG